jgi:hypothetical protein
MIEEIFSEKKYTDVPARESVSIIITKKNQKPDVMWIMLLLLQLLNHLSHHRHHQPRTQAPVARSFAIAVPRNWLLSCH